MEKLTLFFNIKKYILLSFLFCHFIYTCDNMVSGLSTTKICTTKKMAFAILALLNWKQ